MKSKLLYLSAVILQIVIILCFIQSETVVSNSETRFVLKTSMVELQRFTNSHKINLSYPVNSLTSGETDYEIGEYAINQPIYVKVKRTADSIEPIFFSPQKPQLAAGELLLKGKVVEAAEKKLYKFKYTKSGKQREGRWQGKIRTAKKGGKVMVALDPDDPAKIKFVSDWKEYKNKVAGKILKLAEIKTTPANDYQLTVQFQDGEQVVHSSYIYLTHNRNEVPILGAPVTVNFNKTTDGYKVLFVDLNPLVTAKVTEIQPGYLIKAVFGIEHFQLETSQKQKLNELIDKLGDANVSVEVAVDESGDTALTGIFLQDQKIKLN